MRKIDNKWAEAFEQQHGDLENLASMLFHFERWCETKGLRFSEVQRRAKAYKQMFDGADLLVKEGFEPPQVSLILQHYFD
jgi:hypothetical protein